MIHFIKKAAGYIQRRIKWLFLITKERKIIVKAYNFLHTRQVFLVYVELPRADKIKNLTGFENERIKNWTFNFNNIEEELPRLRLLYGNDIDAEYILSLFDGGIVVDGGNRRRVLDFCNEYVHIVNGVRMTSGQPVKSKNTIYTHGACTVRGTGVEDSQTIASFLQEKINAVIGTKTYRVVNMGIGRGSTVQDDYEQMKETCYFPGDIVVWCPFNHIYNARLPEKVKTGKGFHLCETSSLFNGPHEFGEWFTDNVLHTNKTGNQIIANFIFNELLSEKPINGKAVPFEKKYSLITASSGTKAYADNPELRSYLKNLKQFRKSGKNFRIGAIVMNCNPFTNGHKYLIEYAASQVDFLYIFTVEENKSYFSFEDRIELIKQGTAHINNVVVLPSGKFIISALTFPGYFYKDDLKDAVIDCSDDVTIFAQHIAPALNITIRFAGEEPLDPVTSQYNQAMADILPCYSIEFKIIPRKEKDGQIISASLVRKYYEQGNLTAIEGLVPSGTYNYLLARYEREHKMIHDNN
jgi:[citrate (pro-3S)-lyase] ligase